MALAELEKPFGIIVYPGAHHVLREVAEERDTQAIRFFQSHLK
jgi:hypothetical protein